MNVGSDVTIEGLEIGGYAFSSGSSSTMLTAESVPLPRDRASTVTYQVVVAAGEELVATVQAVGATTSLSLLDAQGQVVMQSDGRSAAEPTDAIDTYLGPGRLLAAGPGQRGGGSFSLTAMMMPAQAPLQPIYRSAPRRIAAGDFSGNGILDLAVPGSVRGSRS